MTGIQAVVWKEWREIAMQLGSLRGGTASLLFVIGVFGAYPLFQHDPGWITSPSVLVFSAWIPFFLVSNVVADSFAGERERHTLETLLASCLSDQAILFGKVLASVSYGWAIMLLILLLQLLGINVVYGGNGFLMYSGIVAFGSIGLSLGGAGLAASAGVLVSLRAGTVRQAQQMLSLLGMSPVLLVFMGSRILSGEQAAHLQSAVSSLGLTQAVLLAIAVPLILDISLLLVARLRFRRSLLILA